MLVSGGIKGWLQGAVSVTLHILSSLGPIWFWRWPATMTSHRSSCVMSWSSLLFSGLWSRVGHDCPSLRAMWMGQYSVLASFCAVELAMVSAETTLVESDSPWQARGMEPSHVESTCFDSRLCSFEVVKEVSASVPTFPAQHLTGTRTVALFLPVTPMFSSPQPSITKLQHEGQDNSLNSFPLPLFTYCIPRRLTYCITRLDQPHHLHLLIRPVLLAQSRFH